MKIILHVFDTKAEAEAVFDAITTSKGLAGWWTTEVTAEPEHGGRVQFTFEDGFNPVMEVTEFQAPVSLGWRCIDGHEPWKDNTFSWRIKSSGSYTRVQFRQLYAHELTDDQYGIYNFNWGYYLESLRLLLDDGRGKPYVPR